MNFNNLNNTVLKGQITIVTGRGTWIRACTGAHVRRFFYLTSLKASQQDRLSEILTYTC